MSFLSTPHDEIMYDTHTSTSNVVNINLRRLKHSVMNAFSSKNNVQSFNGLFYSIGLGVSSENDSPKFALL